MASSASMAEPAKNTRTAVTRSGTASNKGALQGSCFEIPVEHQPDEEEAQQTCKKPAPKRHRVPAVLGNRK